jgi:hypothetical protein
MAGSFKVTLDVEGRGPLFDGRADAALQDWARATTKAIADEGVTMLRAVPMNKTGRARGGFQANLHVLQRGGNGTEAQIPAPMIRGVTWGPWLEGTSQRNDSTRFKGYHLFRQTRQALQKLAPEIGQAELDKILPRIGGTP